MPEIRYCDLVQNQGSLRVTTVGTQPGPGGGDNWTLVGRMRQTRMPAGAGQYAIVVSGKFGDQNFFGTGAVGGVMQVCLGTEDGLKHPQFLAEWPVTSNLNWKEGANFQFLLLICSAFPDSIYGSSFNPATQQMCLWARVYTNGDPQTYGCDFTVAGLTWQWWDLTHIPAGHWIADEVATAAGTSAATQLPSSAPTTFQRVGPVAAGEDGEDWLHFANVWYQPRHPGGPAPMFRFGLSQDGTWGAFAPKIGSGGRWGQNRCPSGVFQHYPHSQQGGFWAHRNVGDDTKAGYAGWEQPAAVNRTLVHRYRHFAVRIDTLPDLLTNSAAGPFPAGLPETGAWPDLYRTQERPQPSPRLLSEAVVMVHQVPDFGPSLVAYGTRVTELGDGATYRIGDDECFPQSDPQRNEAVSSMVFGHRQFQVLSPAMQYRVHLVGSSQAPAAAQNARDYHFVHFHPVRDPNSAGDPPGTRPPAMVLVPGKQAVDPASLPLPPFPPSANPIERGVDDLPAIRGGTGYRRTWPHGARALRVFGVSWDLADDDARTLYAFLVATPAWRYTAPRSQPLAVLSVSRPEIQPISHRTARVNVDVAVLTWTGV